MNWEKFWDNTGKSKSVTNQVQRKSLDSVKITTKNILHHLQITKNDEVLDVCCGNGLLTNLIHENAEKIIGIDFSQTLLNSAKKNYPHINFIKGSATDLCSHFQHKTFDKIYLQFSFQYFEHFSIGKKVVKEMISLLNPNGKIFIGDIPNRNLLWDYYNTLAKRFFYITSKLRGKNRMGKFWKKEELDCICNHLNVKGTYIKQKDTLPYAHYRFDYLIEK